MGKQKNLKNGITLDEEIYIDEKMKNGIDERYSNTPPYINKVLNFKVNLKCKNQKQKELHKLIREKEIVFCSSSAGTGKSFVVFSTLLELLKEDNQYNKIVLIVPTSVSGDDIGLLPGTIDDKMNPFYEAHVQTIKKILRLSGNNDVDKIVEDLIKYKFIEIRPCNYLRSFSFSNSLVVCEESQNFVKHSIKTILTRHEETCKLIMVGDIDQIDNPKIMKNKSECGLIHALDKLKNLEEIGTIELTECVRNPIITKILQRWD